jgi:hypothetical protein
MATPDYLNACIDQIQAAFSDCPKPSRKDLVSDEGLDSNYVRGHWKHHTRESVQALTWFTDDLAEDLSYMSPGALRYFLPSVLILFLKNPGAIDFSGFITVVGRLESMFGCGSRPEAYRPVVLTAGQLQSIQEWCRQIIGIIDQFWLGSFQDKYFGLLIEIQDAAGKYVCERDYDVMS